MKILILGGTGAMGIPLVKKLAELDNHVYVTSRGYHENIKNVVYIQGNAQSNSFLENILKEKYDAIIDFMYYSTWKFELRIGMLLNYTNQYFYISSARCYADTDQAIEENSIRLLDDTNDKIYLSTDDYALAKARQENILRQSQFSNWTIIRPYITYNSQKMQLGCYEKEFWLYRVLRNKTLVLPEDILSKTTTLTYGNDVAECIVKLIGNEKALGECFTITTKETHTWREILEYYNEIVLAKTGQKIKVSTIPSSAEMYGVCNEYQIKFDRMYNRRFNIDKLDTTIGRYEFLPTKAGIEKCVNEFMENPQWGNISAKYEAWSDRHAHEWSSLSEFRGIKEKLRYIKWRFWAKP